jgi:hypothetical protein
MSISINCKLSLSKKLRALVGKEATLTLVSQDIVDGKGTAILTLDSADTNGTIKPEEMGETSIMLIPVEIAEEAPNTSSPVHASIFSTVPQGHHKEPIVKKLAAVSAPEEGEEARAIKDEIEVPEAFSDVQIPECKAWVKNMEELIDAINVAKNKKSNVDIDSAQNDRQKALLQEMKEKEEAIDIPAWIVNDKVGEVSVNDLKISLKLNSPYDLSNISARRIAMSKDLKGLLREGYVRFISPTEKDRFVLKTMGETETIASLDVFDNHEQAMDNMGNIISSRKSLIIDEETAMDVTEKDVETKTEDESMILNLTQDMPVVKTRQVPEGNRKSTHSNTSNPPTPKNPNNNRSIPNKITRANLVKDL